MTFMCAICEENTEDTPNTKLFPWMEDTDLRFKVCDICHGIALKSGLKSLKPYFDAAPTVRSRVEEIDRLLKFGGDHGKS